MLHYERVKHLLANNLSFHIPFIPGMGSKQFFLLKKINVAYQIKGNEAYDNIQTNVIPLHTLTTPGMGKRSKVLFSEGGLVAYQIKKNEALNKMQALILTVCTPCYFGLSIKVNYRNVAFKYIFITLAF